MQASIEPVQVEYIRELARTRRALEEQLADMYHVLTAVTDGSELCDEGPLESARAAYISYLRDRHFTFDQLVADIAAVCACLFLIEHRGG